MTDPHEALADPVRRAIVELLAGGERTAGDIAARFPISRPAVSRHLRVLREAELVRSRGDAERRVYRLETDPLSQMERWLQQVRAAGERSLDRLGDHLDTMEREGR